jgi:hypothetical protein
VASTYGPANPGVVDGLSREAASVEGVQEVEDVRVRWLGHRLEADLHIVVDEDLPTRESRRLAEDVRHHLFHAHPRAPAPRNNPSSGHADGRVACQLGRTCAPRPW